MLQDESMAEEELRSYRAHIGRKLQEKDGVSPEVVRRFAAALDREWPYERLTLPPMWHYGLFLSSTPTSMLGNDGHPPRGGFMPPVRLPRRMVAGAFVRFHAPIVAGEEAAKVPEIVSVDFRKGKFGDLVLVRVLASVFQRDQMCVEEEQTIVYRGDGHLSLRSILHASR
jgi:3-methylfumaryl-CoA hydratase